MRHILFVDDEIKVLQGLTRMLRPMRNEWDMTFIDDPRKVLELLEQRPYDAIVVDMKMPQMDGAEVLTKVRELKPGIARIVLSGHAEREGSLRSVGLAHQFLAKPCDADTLRATVSRACELRGFLVDAGLADTVCQLGKLPSLPKLYQAITDEIAREDASLARVAAIIGQDLSMTAKVLQLVNSAFFGLGRRVADIDQAVSYLGVDVIRSLVASHSAFSAFETVDLDFFQQLWRHSSLTAALAKAIAQLASDDPIVHAESFQAGMLHDIGALVLAARLPNEYRDARRHAESGKGSLAARELEVFGCDHGRIGAYLMGLWGLSDRIVEAIAYHDRPSACSYQKIAPLTAVHAASALVLEAMGREGFETKLDLDYLEVVGCAGSLPKWREEAARIVANTDDQDRDEQDGDEQD
ncbi:MAG TPA: response regulator [Gammaproteobacteria bacterium]|nr:response regulator [Gammaproteobacteria bacterium]